MKIDITKIDGYETMSDEEKIKALESYEVDLSGYVEKKLFDKASSDVAALKKAQRENMSEAERLKAEQQESIKKMQDELNSLKMEKQISDITSKYISLGYDEQLAADTAKSYINGDLEKVFNNQKAFQESMEKKIKADIIKGTPAPGSNGTGSSVLTKADLLKMTPAERYNFSVERPDEYKAIYDK